MSKPDEIEDLCRLMPRGPALDATAVAFEAGRRAGRAAVWRWRGAAASSAVALLAILAVRTDQGMEVSGEGRAIAIVVPTPAHADPQSPPFEFENVLELREAVLRGGLDALPSRDLPAVAVPMRVGGAL